MGEETMMIMEMNIRRLIMEMEEDDGFLECFLITFHGNKLLLNER